MNVRWSGASDKKSRLMPQTIIRTLVTIDIWTYNWSPLKSPNATILLSPVNPRVPASTNLVPVNRFFGNGQNAAPCNGEHIRNENRRPFHDSCSAFGMSTSERGREIKCKINTVLYGKLTSLLCTVYFNDLITIRSKFCWTRARVQVLWMLISWKLYTLLGEVTLAILES